MSYLPEKTIKYKTYIKTALVESLKPVFEQHVDKKLQNTKVIIEQPKEHQSFPSVVVKFYEQEIRNAGVGHEEWVTDPDGGVWKFKHYFYDGDIELGIFALSALDRDLIADSLVQTLAMGSLTSYTNNFFNRIYPPDSEQFPDSVGHFININTDKIQGFGETTTKTPWNSEDDIVYNMSYRVKVFGEFYSLPPDFPHQYISKVFTYPYIENIDKKPSGIEGEFGWN